MWTTFRIDNMDDVRSIFGDELDQTDFTLNWCFLSTSGVHGSYGTLDMEQEYFDDPDRFVQDMNCGEPYKPCITVTVVKPRVVQMGSGNIPITKEDIPYLRELVRRTLVGVAESQEGNT